MNGVKHNLIAALVVPKDSHANNSAMTKKTTRDAKPLEAWQVEDAARLKALFVAKKTAAKDKGTEFSQEKFAEAHGLKSGNMVWQYLNAHRPLNIRAAAAFARGLGRKVEDFSPALAVEVGQVAETSAPAVRIIDSQVGRKLQWLSDDEAQLLSNYRACAEPEKLATLDYTGALPKINVDQRSDQRETGP